MAHATLADLHIYYTGGGSNSTPSASIGGAISSTRILAQTASALTTLTGVTINEGRGNGTAGTGTLTWTPSTGLFTWQPYGGSVGSGVSVTADGTYWVQGGSNGGGLSITVVYASLPTSTTSNTVTLTNSTQKFFIDTTKDVSDAGSSQYHCFAVKNAHATEKMVDVTLWRAADTNGLDTISMYLDPLAASNGAVGPTAVANENTAPAASTFVVPDSRTHASALAVGTLTAGQVRFFWLKLLTPADVDTETLVNIFQIGAYIRG